MCWWYATLAVDEAGKVWSWGINDNAVLSFHQSCAAGAGSRQSPRILEAEVLKTQPMVVQTLVVENFHAMDISAGNSVSVALGHEGDLQAWGSFPSSDGLLGFNRKLGSSKTQVIPLPIPTLKLYQFVLVTCGTDHVTLTTAGHIYTWGSGQATQLGCRMIEQCQVNGLSPE